MEILDLNWMAVMTQAIGFVLLVLAMSKFVFGPVGKLLEERRQSIQQTLDQIAADRQAMERTRADYEQRLANIEAEARVHMAGAVNQAKEEAAAILARAREEAVAQRERALTDIDQERKKALAQIRGEMADLAVRAAGKVLEREINPAVHRELVNDFIREVGARQ